MGESLQLHFRKMMQAGDFLTDIQWLLYMVIIASSLMCAGVIPFKAVQSWQFPKKGNVAHAVD